MPWLRARLREQLVYARATEAGALLESGGSVEVRYQPNDGRLYKARAQNLTVVDPKALPDETCGEAAPVESQKKPASRAAEGPAPAPGRGARAAGPLKSAALRAGVPAVPAGAVVAYTDGACSGNPGPAGLGVVVLEEGAITEISEYLGQGTNNVAELTAVLRALERVPDLAQPLVVHTDSQYAIGVLTKGWKAKANTELVLSIRKALSGRAGCRLVYVPGHSGVPLNERADQLAREAVERRESRVMNAAPPGPGRAPSAAAPVAPRPR